MSSSPSIATPEQLHPSLWRASQLAQSATRCVDTGHASLSAQLPGGGWPTGTLIDLLLQQQGIGELRLLQPALAAVAARRIVLLQPPHPPQALALAALGIDPEKLLWLRSNNNGDALWAAEQVLRSGSCGALLFWLGHAWPGHASPGGTGPEHAGWGHTGPGHAGQRRAASGQTRGETLRRLHLAAQSGETLFYMLRPLAAAQDASPAPLRLGLRPRAGGIEIDFVKRRGPQRDAPLFLPLTPSLLQRHASLDRHLPAPAPARRVLPELVD